MKKTQEVDRPKKPEEHLDDSRTTAALQARTRSPDVPELDASSITKIDSLQTFSLWEPR